MFRYTRHRLGLEGGPPLKLALTHPDDPVESSLRWGNPRAEFMAVEWKPGLEAQRVTGAEASRFDTRRHDSVPYNVRRRRRRGDLDAILTRVPGTGNEHLDVCDRGKTDSEPANSTDCWRDGLESSPSIGTLHGEHSARRGDVSHLEVGTTQRIGDAVGVGCVGHDVEPVGLDPPHDDVVEHRTVGGVEEMGVLRPSGFDASEIIGERRLQRAERAVTHYSKSAQV